MWPFTDYDYKKDFMITSSAFVESSIDSLGAIKSAFNDNKYSRLTEKSMKKMVDKYVPPLEYDYSEDVFDCDDAALLSLAGMVKGANKEGFVAPIAFGVVSYTRPDGIGHMMNVSFTAEGNIIYFDPFQRKWYRNLPEHKSVDSIQF